MHEHNLGMQPSKHPPSMWLLPCCLRKVTPTSTRYEQR